jgi:hypothetical protein
MQYLLMCRSLTYAQQGARVLERVGITATVSRAPKTITNRGCAYCIIVSSRAKERALALLSAAQLRPERVLLRREDGSVQEVET